MWQQLAAGSYTWDGELLPELTFYLRVRRAPNKSPPDVEIEFLKNVIRIYTPPVCLLCVNRLSDGGLEKYLGSKPSGHSVQDSDCLEMEVSVTFQLMMVMVVGIL